VIYSRERTLKLTTVEVPPAAGQGINQGFEDVHSLSLLIAATKSGADWRANLDFWQKYRHERVDRVVELTQEMNRRRLPGWKGDNAGAIDSTWLFDVDIGNDVASHLAKC
jgi:ADP-heptose:LPS heptosyltransferase